MSEIDSTTTDDWDIRDSDDRRAHGTGRSVRERSATDTVLTSLLVSRVKQTRQPSLDPIRPPQLALQHGDHRQAQATKPSRRKPVPRDVRLELGRPEVSPSRRGARVSTPPMAVPGAPMNEDHRAEPRKDEVGRAGKVADVQATSQTTTPSLRSALKLPEPRAHQERPRLIEAFLLRNEDNHAISRPRE